MRKGKEKSEEGKKKHILRTHYMPIALPGHLFYLSQVSVQVALVNRHKLLNWPIFCLFFFFFFTSFSYSLCICFLPFGMRLARLPFLVGTSQWETLVQDHKVETKRETDQGVS